MKITKLKISIIKIVFIFFFVFFYFFFFFYYNIFIFFFFFFSNRRRHTRFSRYWSSDVCSSDLAEHAHGFRSIAEALYLRDQLVRQIELADASEDPEEREARCTFVVVGAGY